MNYLIAADTDIGIKKNTNQDSLTVKLINTSREKMVFALLCDGMGGLAKGEIASAEIVDAFNYWIRHDFINIIDKGFLDDSEIRKEWEKVIYTQNQRIMEYGEKHGISLGSTVVAALFTNQRYYIANIGDSRVYELTDEIKQLTKDQTLINREIELGNLTEEEAERDPRRNILLQCVGATETVCPDFFFGETKKNAVYMLCSDGFRHEISSKEIFTYLNPHQLLDQNSMKRNMEYLIELNKSRMENDNISVITVRTY